MIPGDILDTEITRSKSMLDIRHYDQLVQLSPVAMYLTDAHGCIRVANIAAIKLWGRAPKLGEDLWCGSGKIYAPDGTPLPLSECPLAIALRERQSLENVEIIIETPDHDRKHVLEFPSLIRSDSGEVIGALNTLVDITERKTTEGILRASDELLRRATEAAELGTFEGDLATDRFLFSKGMYSIFGMHESEEMTHHILLDTLHPDDRPLRDVAMQSALRDGNLAYEVRMIRRDLDVRWIRVNGKIMFNTLRQPLSIHGIVMDVTDQKSASFRIRESEERLSFATASAELGTWDFYPLTGELIWDERCKMLFGIQGETVMTYNRFLEALHPDDRERTDLVVSFMMKPDSGGHYDIEYRAIHPDSTVKWIRAKGKAYYNQYGESYRFTGTVQDITVQKTAEQSIRENEERVRLASEAANVGTWDIDLASGKIRASEIYRIIIGFDENIEWTQENFFERLNPDHLADVKRVFENGLTEGKFKFEAQIVQPSRQWKWIRVDAQILYDVNCHPFRILGTLIDIDDERTRSEALETTVRDRTRALQIAKEKLEQSNQELEQFAYVASHDLQEPLRKIQTFSSLLSKHINRSPEADRYFERINSSAQRMSVLIRDVLQYSRLSNTGDALEPTSLSEIVNAVVSDYELLILEKNAVVQVGYLPSVMGVTHQLQQLAANLISNALKFSGTHPLIEIHSEPATQQDILQHPELKSEQEYHKIVFKDNGIGFDQKFADQIFTIFQRLNTRESYKGTGIGLAICKRIAENHHGVIFATSAVGNGATFTVILPAIAKTPVVD